MYIHLLHNVMTCSDYKWKLDPSDWLYILEECNKLLGIGSFQEHDDMPYCKTCYGKLFGPKGYGFAGGSAGLSANRDDVNTDEVQMRFVKSR